MHFCFISASGVEVCITNHHLHSKEFKVARKHQDKVITSAYVQSCRGQAISQSQLDVISLPTCYKMIHPNYKENSVKAILNMSSKPTKLSLQNVFKAIQNPFQVQYFYSSLNFSHLQDRNSLDLHRAPQAYLLFLFQYIVILPGRRKIPLLFNGLSPVTSRQTHCQFCFSWESKIHPSHRRLEERALQRPASCVAIPPGVFIKMASATTPEFVGQAQPMSQSEPSRQCLLWHVLSNL